MAKNESAFTDVSKEKEQAQKDAEKPAEFDSDGNLKVDEKGSEASAKLYDEAVTRASAGANGGGPWPQEVLRKNFVSNARKMDRGAGEYTSHES